MDYDHLTGQLQLQGQMRALLPPSAPAARPAMTAPLVFITGASSGIGQALALRFAQAGWRLALVARRGAELQAWVDAQGLDAERGARLRGRRARRATASSPPAAPASPRRACPTW